MESTAQGSEPSGGLTLTGLDGKVVVVTGAGRRRSIGRAIAVELARAGCDVVLTGTGRAPERYPDDEKAVGWRDVDSVADEVRELGRRAFGRRLVAQGDGGSIVNISSIGGKMMAARTAAYAASKAGIHALTSAMSQELGAAQVRVNAICPGIIDTFRMDDVPRGEAWDRLVERQIPLGRAGTGQDVAWMVAYLCSDQGSWITGQFYTVDGGTVPGR